MKRTIAAMTAIVFCLGMAVVTPGGAQSPAAPEWSDSVNPHHLKIRQLMRDMTQEMNKMTEQMSPGALTPEQQKQMARRMTFMSAMMHRLSGLEARPAMREGDWQKQMDEMRKQMDQMMR